MAVKNEHKRLLQKLQKKIKKLQKREEQARAQLQVAIKTIHKLAHEYKIKLALKKRVMESQVAEMRKKSYVKIIAELEDMIIKGIKKRSKALTSAIEKIDARQLSKPSRKKRKKKPSKKKRK